MRYHDAVIPAGQSWSSPFVKWQGSLAEVSSLDLAEAVTRRALAERAVDPARIEGIVLGWTVPQPEIFYGAPTLAARIGAPGVTGPMISQACATSVAAVHAAAAAVDSGAGPQLVVTTDRTSNSPQMVHPSPSARGGSPRIENWVWDNFQRDPWPGTSTLDAGEAVAAELGTTREELDDLAVLRWEQYRSSLADDRAFQRRYMVPVEITHGRRSLVVDADEGVRPVEQATVGTLNPTAPGGVHTFATQTHPADGCAGAVVTSAAAAREMSDVPGVVRLRASGFARAPKTRMPQAPVPAAAAALADAGLSFADVHAVTTHNPFAVNDVYFSAETGIAPDRMNRRGCSLVFGHPQGPTGLRSIGELIEELRERGGGIGLFTGCAAGDTGAALVVEVTD